MASDDLTRPSLVAQAKSGHPLLVPWGQKQIALLASFDSSRMPEKEGPWVLASPFDISATKAIVQHDNDGGSIMYREGLSTRSTSSTEHLSASLAVSVSVPLAEASVSASYDKMVIANENDTQASRNASCRLGRIVLADTPRFTEEAAAVLADWRIDGKARFRELYGDYFVSGYVLGADAGACLSAGAHNKSETKRVDITVTVKVLWVEASAKHVEVDTKSTSEATMRFFGYNTLTNESLAIDVSTRTADDLSKLQWHITQYMQQIRKLEGTARKRLKELGLDSRQEMTLATGSALCTSGLVVQLLLFPYARLAQFVSLVPTKEQIEAKKKLFPDWDQPRAAEGRRLQDGVEKILANNAAKRTDQ